MTFQGIRRHKLHSDLRRANPKLSKKDRNEIIDHVERIAFLRYLAEKVGV